MAYTRERWESRIKEAGAGRYDFVRWAVDGEYGALKKCVVKCVIDGFEWESATNNITSHGIGCPQCSGVRRWTAEERIEQINNLGGILFVRFDGEYKNQKSIVVARCTIDGFEWRTTVDRLINGRCGCPHCARKRRWTANERVEQINNREDIDFISWDGAYKNYNSRAIVKCKIDGYEWSSSIECLINSARGCPKCANRGYNPSITGFLYALRSECGQYIKVGISNKPSRRHSELARATPFKFNIVEQFEGGGAKIASLEKHFHENYESAGFSGFDGATEWLVCSDELLSELRSV